MSRVSFVRNFIVAVITAISILNIISTRLSTNLGYKRIEIETVSNSNINSNIDDLQFPLSSNISEWILDLSSAVGCGKSKCAFRSKNHPNTHGYLVSKAEDLIRSRNASELAHNISQQSDIRVFYRGHPKAIDCSTTLEKDLEERIDQFRKSVQYYNCKKTKKKKTYYTAHPVGSLPMYFYEIEHASK